MYGVHKKRRQSSFYSEKKKADSSPIPGNDGTKDVKEGLSDSISSEIFGYRKIIYVFNSVGRIWFFLYSRSRDK
ncbi:hypothetical protein CEXT_130191 [Caerostris extrusa]|uniref:Uncharacterized protein n=1 Tax=Caerostris extrusa TaxID=172846 RepID=A0AAV4VZM1_CAEEX|nr:hypothetical protein CEXT_130191 [Caerostris extrusa]